MVGILAFLNPDHIPMEIFTTVIAKRALGFLYNEGDLRKLFRELERRQLIRRDFSTTETCLAIHRTVQRNVLVHLSRDVARRWAVFQQAFKLV